jgi:hypothetical protein
MSHSVGRICLFGPSLHLIDRRCQRPRPSDAVRRTKPKLRAGWEIGTPKSRKSRRTVLLERWLAGDLRAYLATHPRRDARVRRCSRADLHEPPATLSAASSRTTG